LGFKLLYIVFNYTAFVNNPQHAILSTEGNWIGGILLAAVSAYLKYREKEKTRLPQPVTEDVVVHPYELVANMTMIAAVSGIIGARIFHILENFDSFIVDPMDMLLSFSGLTFYGGLIAGAIAVIVYARKYKIPTLHLIDACAPGLMLAYGVGRIGCQVAGDGDWGIDNLNPKPNWLSFIPDWAWSYRYPHNVGNEGVPIPGCIGHHCNQLANPVYPTPLYECIMSILLFIFLWSIRKRVKTPGILFCIYLIVNGIERFFIEKIRVNTLYHIFGHGITQAEIISTCLVILGVVGIVVLNKKKALPQL
jgi:phosphatidylglycerol:prolipoprotein diacylglycerol transferase